MNISQLKSNLQIIITKLKQLQTHRDNLSKNHLASEITEITECKHNLEEAFAIIESEPIENVVAKVKKRKTKRLKNRLKRRSNAEKSSSTSLYEVPGAHTLENKPLTALKKRKLRSANKYLAIMQSLETLHQLRGGGDACKLKESLSTLQSIWQSTADAITAGKQTLSSVEAQWDQVLFGGISEIEMEVGVRNLIEKRCIWDSYLVSEDNSTGSYIPIGWVYPKEDAQPEWKQFSS